MSKPVLFQNMPPLSPEEYSELEASVKEHGIQVPILIDEDGVVIDGHHRQKIAQELGIRCPKRQVIDKTESEKRTLALSLNVHRRHLSREQKRALIAESIKADPQLSNREHARRMGVDDKTVGTARRDLEESAEIPHFDKRIDPRTGAASQPATRPSPESGEDIDGFMIRYRESVNVQMGREPDDNGPQIEDTGLKCGPGITGMDGKTYTRPEPNPEPDKPRRNPLPDQARTAGWEVRKSVERVERIMSDDRFTRNKEEVAAHLRGHLQYAIETLQTTLDQLN